MDEEMNKLSKLFGGLSELINVKSIEAMGIKFFASVAIVLAAFWISRILQRSIDRHMGHGTWDDDGAIFKYKIIVRFIVLVPGVLFAVHVLGFNLSSLFTHASLIAIALGFALKNIAENYTSGMMLRLERIISPGDVLETEGAMVRVKSIGLRSTIVRSKYKKGPYYPNSQLVQDRIVNYTYKDTDCRFETTVGVAYASDLKKVREVLESVCNQLDWASPQHKPSVILFGFGDSAVNYKIRVWIENPWDAGGRQALLNEAIWWGLKEAGIVMAYPQLDVHFDEAYKMKIGSEQAHIGEEKNEK